MSMRAQAIHLMEERSRIIELQKDDKLLLPTCDNCLSPKIEVEKDKPLSCVKGCNQT